MRNSITLNNTAKLLLNGTETLSAIKDSLTRAERFINLEYFSFHEDETGRTVAGILSERAAKGVKVRMITDAAGSWRLSRKFIRSLKDSGIEFLRFSPFTFHRDHRKIITVDGVTGFLGGFNIGDVYLRQWRDTHLMIKGDAVGKLDSIFAKMWRKSGGLSEIETPEAESSGIFDGVPVMITASGNGEDFRAIADEYIRIINKAGKRIWITTPYFVPDEKFLMSLYSASGRGVDVRLIIPSSSNHTMVSWASRSYIDELIAGGVRVFVYRDRFIHAKTMIADSHVASVGTANIDALSFGINYEVQAFVYSTRLVNELERVFIEDLRNCTEETESSRALRKRPALERLKEFAGRMMSPLL
ncbi:MAG: cardiolipin synthase [Synergistaceae bacterium]|nr:cardiolipin synthase [Synergistaceae bacterium]